MDNQSPVTSSSGYDDETSPHDGRPVKRRKRTSTTGPREIGIMRKPTDGSASFLGSSSGIHFIRTVYNAFARRSVHQNQAKGRSENLVPGEDDQLQTNPDANENNSELWSKHELDYTSNGPYSFEKLVRWTRNYFENWHPMFPFLHAPTVLHLLERVSRRGLVGVSRTDTIIIRSIVSMSLTDQRQMNASSTAPKTEPVPAALVFRTVGQARESAQILFSEATTIQLLQAAFSVELLLTSLLHLNTASRIGGVVTRNAFHLGLHRCPARFSLFNPEDETIRRRLFWSIYCLERYLSQALGVPLSIKDDDIDVCYPGIERHKQRADDDKRLRLLGHLAKFAKVRGLILELRNKSILHSHDSSIGATQVNGELAHWWNEVYDDVYPVDISEDTDQQEALRPFHSLVLTVLRHESIISMNRPLLATEGVTPESATALQICIESSRSLITALAKYMAPSPAKSQESEPPIVPLVWPSFTWAVWMACLILMYAAWEREFPVPVASRYAKLGLSVLENLSLRGSSWPKTCIEAIRDLETALTKTADDPNPPIRYPTTTETMVPSARESYPFQGSNIHHNQTIPPGRRPALPNRPPPISPADHRAQTQNSAAAAATTNFEPYDTHPGYIPRLAAADGDNDNQNPGTSPGTRNNHLSSPTNNRNHGLPQDSVNTIDHNGSTTPWGNYNSAGLIFGESYISGAPVPSYNYNPTAEGSHSHPGLFPGQPSSSDPSTQEGLSLFSSSGPAGTTTGAAVVDWESIFTSDIWSVADGPWLMHENGL